MTKINNKKVEEFIRVDHAGERGAIKIYEGQLLALNTFIKDDSLKKTIDYIPDNIFTIADAKRGDIGNTSKMYAEAFFNTYNF